MNGIIATNPPGVFVCFCSLFVFILMMAGLAIWIYALVDCLKYEKSPTQDNLVWVLVILFLNVIGAALYLLIRRPQRIQEQRALEDEN